MNAAPDDRRYAVGWRKAFAPACDPFTYVKSESDRRGGDSPYYAFTHQEATRIARALAVQPDVGSISIRSRPPKEARRGQPARMG